MPANAQISASASDDEALLVACEQSLACSRHLKRANELQTQGMYSPAQQEYQDAYVLQPYPLILYNIGRICHKQNQLVEAIAYYQRYLATSNSQRADRARQLLLEAQQELAAERALRESEPAPAELVPAVLPTLLPTIVPSPRPTARLPEKHIYQRWWFWTLTGVAAASIATAVGLGVYASGPDVSGRPAMTAVFGH